MSDTPWLTLAQAAARLQTSDKTILRAIRAGRLKALRLGVRRAWRVHAEWLQAFAEAESTVVNGEAPGPPLAALGGVRPKPRR